MNEKKKQFCPSEHRAEGSPVDMILSAQLQEAGSCSLDLAMLSEPCIQQASTAESFQAYKASSPNCFLLPKKDCDI